MRSNSWLERYQADTVELDNRITHNHAYPFLWTIIDHFSKYSFTYEIPEKKVETIRNYMVKAFIIWDPQMIYTDDRKD